MWGKFNGQLINQVQLSTAISARSILSTQAKLQLSLKLYSCTLSSCSVVYVLSWYLCYNFPHLLDILSPLGCEISMNCFLLISINCFLLVTLWLKLAWKHCNSIQLMVAHYFRKTVVIFWIYFQIFWKLTCNQLHSLQAYSGGA